MPALADIYQNIYQNVPQRQMLNAFQKFFMLSLEIPPYVYPLKKKTKHKIILSGFCFFHMTHLRVFSISDMQLFFILFILFLIFHNVNDGP